MCSKLASRLSELSLRADERARATHGRFNLFTTLLSFHDEERLHTRFLHALLDPNGLHDCGTQFLDLFFETLREVPPRDHNDEAVEVAALPAASDCRAFREYGTDQGSLDLFLEATGSGIALENKIFAQEQPRQIARYQTFLERRYPAEGSRYLLYLTRFGEASTTHEDKPYLRISYREHILAWLEKCLRASYAQIPLNQALLQYRAVVKQVVELPPDPDVMEEATKFLAKNPDILRYRSIINEAAEAVRLRFLKDVLDRVSAAFKGSYTVVPVGDSARLGREEDTNFHLVPDDSSHSLRSPEFNLTLEYWAQDGRNRYAYGRWIFGVDLGHSIRDDERHLFGRMREFLETSGLGEGYYPPIPSALSWPLGWWQLIPDLSDELLAAELECPSYSDPNRLRREIEARISLVEAAYLGAKGESARIQT